jgi:predicted TIM-barrel fold metal-dependent hydrolase
MSDATPPPSPVTTDPATPHPATPHRDLRDQMLQQIEGMKRDVTEPWPDLTPAPLRHRVISVDDHVIEPSDVFAGRVPARFADAVPCLERVDGIDYWIFGDQRNPVLGSDAIQSWQPGRGYPGPVCLDDLRPGCWNPDERVRDMDIGGTDASLNFPSSAFGFAGQRFLRHPDREVALVALRAYNDWIIEAWAGAQPDRLIPCQLAWMADPEIAAADVYRNAERGFKAVTFSENPEKLGLPSIYREHWDPFLRACEETETVVNLHVGSSSETLVPSTDSPMGVLAALFPVSGLAAATDWLFALVPVRFPRIKIAFSEGGIGWVPMLLDRLRYMERYGWDWAEFGGVAPAELIRRNYWFTSFGDPTTLRVRDVIGTDRIMIETDYPHGDSSWPDTQRIVGEQLFGMPDEDIANLTHATAAALYRHPLRPAR